MAGIREIYTLSGFGAFLERAGMSEGKGWMNGKGEGMCEELREAVRRSENAGYHRLDRK